MSAKQYVEEVFRLFRDRQLTNWQKVRDLAVALKVENPTEAIDYCDEWTEEDMRFFLRSAATTRIKPLNGMMKYLYKRHEWSNRCYRIDGFFGVVMVKCPKCSFDNEKAPCFANSAGKNCPLLLRLLRLLSLEDLSQC